MYLLFGSRGSGGWRRDTCIRWMCSISERQNYGMERYTPSHSTPDFPRGQIIRITQRAGQFQINNKNESMEGCGDTCWENPKVENTMMIMMYCFSLFYSYRYAVSLCGLYGSLRKSLTYIAAKRSTSRQPQEEALRSIQPSDSNSFTCTSMWP